MSNWQSPPGQGPYPYKPPAASFYGSGPPPKSSSTGLWIALAISGVLLIVCGGGCVGLVMFGLNISEEEIKAQLQDNPKIREHIGEIESIDMDIVASGAEDDSDVFVYRIKGDKGSGRITIREGAGEGYDTLVEEATLRLPDGTEVKVVP